MCPRSATVTEFSKAVNILHFGTNHTRSSHFILLLIDIMAHAPPNFAAFLPAAAANLIIEERAIPTPGPEEVLIHNHCIGLNPIDWKRQAWGFMINSYPTILGAGMFNSAWL